MNYNVDWEKTVENITFMMQGRTYKKNFSELFGITERAVQTKISTDAKSELSISELLMLADYFECEIWDLVVLEDDTYIGPKCNWQKGWRKIEVEDTSQNDVKRTLEFLNKIEKSYEIRNLYEFFLYLPLIEEEYIRDMIMRLDGDLTYNRKPYIMHQLSKLYRNIPDCKAKREADNYRDNVLRVKGVPGNNLYGLYDEEYMKYYSSNLQRYFEEGNSKLWSGDYEKKQCEKKRKACLGL